MATISKVEEFSNNIVRQELAGKVSSISVVVDTSAENLATGNVYKVLGLAPYTIIHQCQTVVTTAEGAVATFDVGVMGDDITDDPNGLDDAVDGNATGINHSSTSDAAIGLDIGASGGYITVSVDNAMDACIFKITALVSRSQN